MNIGSKEVFLQINGSNALYDSKVEWLESTGTLYIELPFLPNQDTGYEIDFQVVNAKNSAPFFVRWSFDPTYDSFGIGFTSISALAIFYGRYSTGQYKIYGSTSAALDRYILKQLNKKIYVNGTLIASFTSSFLSPIKPYLFGQHAEGQGNPLCACKIWSFKHFQGEELKLDFTPVRVGNVGYMLDNVSGQLFGNLGTGNFVLGPDVK